MHTAHVAPVPLSTTSSSSSPSSPALAPPQLPRRKLRTRSWLENTAVLATAATSSALSSRVSGGRAAAAAARCACSLRFNTRTTESRTHRAPKVTHALVAAFGQSPNSLGDSRVTTTVLPCFGSLSKVSSTSPDSLETKTDGTFTSLSSAFFAMGISEPSTLSKTTTATAPAISAFLTLVTKSHFSVPKERCTRAIHRPSYLFVRASHASFGDASSSRAVTPSAGTRGPNTAGSSFS
mmetsp:Transcript_14583/g.61568  ORF Transcript_14583/g.61568 Transcript_14583/m.61568 type:complete len:237 (-) Transcript_14583:204-914(-)